MKNDYKNKKRNLSIYLINCFEYYSSQWNNPLPNLHNEDEDIISGNNCKTCNKETPYNVYNILYKTSKFIIIILTNYKNVKFEIQEGLDLDSFVEDKKESQKYKLIGVILEEENNKLNYSTCFRNSDNDWVLFDNERVYKKDNLRNLIRGKSCKLLIYKRLEFPK